MSRESQSLRQVIDRWSRRLVVLGLLGAVTSPALAQNSDFEGPITKIQPRSGGARCAMYVMGVKIVIKEGDTISSPTATLTVDMINDPTPLPGRPSRPGFLGGTAIITSENRGGNLRPSDVFVEPAENILLGPVSANNAGDISILGIEIKILTDPRMPGEATNALGLPIDTTTVPVGSIATAEGYFGEDGCFYAFLLDAEGDVTGPANQTSITRARCSDGDFRALGGSTTSDGTIDVFDDDTNTFLGSTNIVVDVDTGLGSWQIRLDLGEGVCVDNIRAENSNGSQATAAVDVAPN